MTWLVVFRHIYLDFDPLLKIKNLYIQQSLISGNWQKQKNVALTSAVFFGWNAFVSSYWHCQLLSAWKCAIQRKKSHNRLNGKTRSVMFEYFFQLYHAWIPFVPFGKLVLCFLCGWHKYSNMVILLFCNHNKTPQHAGWSLARNEESITCKWKLHKHS